MAKEVVVSMAVTKVRGLMAESVRRLSSEGVTVNLEDWEGQAFRISDKLAAIRRTAVRFHDYDYVLMADAWDTLFFGTKQDLLDRLPGDKVLWSAEKNCWPDDSIADQIKGESPWRYCNAGLIIGKPANCIKMCDRIEENPAYKAEYIDQGFMNFLLSQGEDFFELDTQTKLFFSLFKGYDELDFENGRPVNRLYNTRPLFLHANGKAPTAEMYRKYEASLK